MTPLKFNSLKVNLLSKVNGSTGSGAASTRAQYRMRIGQGGAYKYT